VLRVVKGVELKLFLQPGLPTWLFTKGGTAFQGNYTVPVPYRQPQNAQTHAKSWSTGSTQKYKKTAFSCCKVFLSHQKRLASLPGLVQRPRWTRAHVCIYLSWL